MKKSILLLLFCFLTFPIFGQDIERAKEHINEARQQLDLAEEALQIEQGIPNINVTYEGDHRFIVSWEPFQSDTSDILFFSPQIHSDTLRVNDYIKLHNNPPNTMVGFHPVGINTNTEVEGKEWVFQLATNKGYSNVEILVVPEAESPDKKTSKLIPIETSEQNGSELMRTDFYAGSITGYIFHEGKYRIYFQNRASHNEDGSYKIEMFESEDLENWSESKETSLKSNERLLTVEGEIQCWIPEGGDAYIWTDFDTYDGCDNRSHQAINNWKIDGTLGPNYFDGEYMQLGRVRGWGPNEEGGWENDLADYPLVEWYPEVVKAYEEQAPNFDPRRNLHDRRGISLHKGKGNEVWSNEIIEDPENTELPGFLGWEYPDKEGIGDFYSATFVDSERILVKIYWKENDRLIDRSNRGDEFIPMNPQRRFRFTGETTVVAATLNGDKIEWESFDSVFPYDHFARRAHLKVTWATCPDCIEVGQFSQASNVMFKNGYAYIPFQYRDDIHYESANDWEAGKVYHLTGIYMYRVPVEKFNGWWN